MAEAANKEGVAFFQQGNFSKAVECFSKAVESNPFHAAYLLNRSAALVAANRPLEALLDSDNALRLNPNNVRAYLRKTNAQIRLLQYTESLETIEAGLRHKNNDPELLKAKAFVQSQMNLHNPVQVEKESVQPVVKEQPVEQQAEPSRRRKFVSSLFGNFSSPGETNNTKAINLLQQGKPLEAIQELNIAISAAPQNSQFLYNRASAYIKTEQYKSAMTDLDHALEIAPTFLLALVKKVQILVVTNQIAAAKNIFSIAKKYAVTDKEKEFILQTYQEICQREVYLNLTTPTPNEDPPPYPGNVPSIEESEDEKTKVIEDDGERAGFESLVNFSKSLNPRSWLFGGDQSNNEMDGKHSDNVLAVVDEDNKEIEVEGFLSFEIANNGFIQLIQRYVREKILSFTTEEGMVLNKIPLFDTNSIQSGQCQLMILIPQHVALDNCPMNEKFLLSHFLLAYGKEDQRSTSFSFFSLNQIIGDIDFIKESVEVLKNPHEEEKSKSGPTVRSQILRNSFFRIGSYETPVRFLLVSEPIYIPSDDEVVNIVNNGKEEGGDVEEEEGEEVIQLTLEQRFRKNYNLPQSSIIRSNVSKFIKKTVKAAPQPEEIAAELSNFMIWVDDSIKANPLWENAKEEDIVCAHMNIRKHILSQLADLTFYYTFPEKDEEIREIINRLWFVLPEQLGMDSTGMDDSIYHCAQRELKAINEFLCPREKIECLLNCCRILNFQIHQEGSYASADDFLPALILVLLNSNPHRLWSNVEYMKIFCEKTDELAEAFYFLTMLEASVWFIIGVKAEQLKMTEREFQEYFSGAIPHHKPLKKEDFMDEKDNVESKLIPSSFLLRDVESISLDEIPLLMGEYRALHELLNKNA